MLVRAPRSETSVYWIHTERGSSIPPDTAFRRVPTTSPTVRLPPRRLQREDTSVRQAPDEADAGVPLRTRVRPVIARIGPVRVRVLIFIVAAAKESGDLTG